MGSLDVLLATPLATASVLWGKWWGAYRNVILMAILPGLIACLSCRGGRWSGPPLVVGLVLAYGAAFRTAVYATAAAVLMVATRDTFDRCLGRIPDRPIARPIAPAVFPRKSSFLSTALLVGPSLLAVAVALAVGGFIPIRGGGTGQE